MVLMDTKWIKTALSWALSWSGITQQSFVIRFPGKLWGMDRGLQTSYQLKLCRARDPTASHIQHLLCVVRALNVWSCFLKMAFYLFKALTVPQPETIPILSYNPMGPLVSPCLCNKGQDPSPISDSQLPENSSLSQCRLTPSVPSP